MSFWILLQVVINLILVAGIVALWAKLKRPAQDDPRLSKGLQLLQTKISVLEDLSDRTDTQSEQILSLLESKIREIQNLIVESDRKLQSIEVSMQKSLEVAKIFQDRIPHQEIVERQNTIKYVKAARMAHQGKTVDEICNEVALSRGEIEFIAKVNKNQLQFSEENLPEWVRDTGEVSSASSSSPTGMSANDIAAKSPAQAAISPQPLAKKEDQVTLSALGDRFRKAIQENTTQFVGAPAVATNMTPPQSVMTPTPIAQTVAATVPQTPQQRAASGLLPTEPMYAQNSKGQEVQIRKVVFPKVNTTNI